MLGITYSTPDAHTGKHTQHFAALLVYEGGDSWLELQDCRAEGLTPFTGDSAAFPHIWAVLQHFIDTRGAFLNGDWPFINAVLGLMAPSATHPCPICIVSHKSFLHALLAQQLAECFEDDAIADAQEEVQRGGHDALRRDGEERLLARSM